MSVVISWIYNQSCLNRFLRLTSFRGITQIPADVGRCCADFRQVVRIGPLPKTVQERSFMAKSRQFSAYLEENPYDESAQVFKNPHGQARIRTVGPESARPSFCTMDRKRDLYALRKRFKSRRTFLCHNLEKRAYLPVGAESDADHFDTKIINRWKMAVFESLEKSGT